MVEEFYTRIFVGTKASHDAVLARVASVLNGRISRWTVKAGSIEADIRRNDDASERQC